MKDCLLCCLESTIRYVFGHILKQLISPDSLEKKLNYMSLYARKYCSNQFTGLYTILCQLNYHNKPKFNMDGGELMQDDGMRINNFGQFRKENFMSEFWWHCSRGT
jgi:hypothetical protein